jgi:hypothetical protein
MRVALCRFACAGPRSCCALSQLPRALHAFPHSRSAGGWRAPLMAPLAAGPRPALHTARTRNAAPPAGPPRTRVRVRPQPRRSTKRRRCRSGRSGREKDRPREDEKAVDTSAMVATVVGSKDASPRQARSRRSPERGGPRRRPWRRRRPLKSHSLRRKAQARVSLCQAGEDQRGDSSLGRHRAGRRGRARFHLPFASARSCWSCWSREENGRQSARSARAIVEVAVPVGGHAGGGQARAVPGEVVRRSRGQRAARVKSGRRAGGRAERTSAIKVGLEIT